jgi:glycine hydroxymethyltransferase
MGEDEMRTIGGWMLEALRAVDDAKVHAGIREQVRELGVNFPAPTVADQFADATSAV